MTLLYAVCNVLWLLTIAVPQCYVRNVSVPSYCEVRFSPLSPLHHFRSPPNPLPATPFPPTLPITSSPHRTTLPSSSLGLTLGHVGAGNHEYDYRTGKEKHKSHNKDPSGAGSPYEPDWGNYGRLKTHSVIVCVAHHGGGHGPAGVSIPLA